MCSIAGIYSKKYEKIDRLKLMMINKSMSIRGPDSSGIWISDNENIGIAHNRLSIIDISDLSEQPMSWKNGKYRIVFNGEIYNYRVLKKYLEFEEVCFNTNSDTEVLLALYEKLGVKMLEVIQGMYAFAIWDKEKESLFIARDPYGIKPLYYSDQTNFFYWSSQIKALVGNINLTPEPAGHVGFFLFGSIPEPYTPYKEIRSLPAGHYLWVDKDVSQIVQFDTPFSYIYKASEFEGNISIKDALVISNNALINTLTKHLISDVPIGVFLSAGIDSSSIVSFLYNYKNNNENITTITLGFNGCNIVDESEIAAKTSKLFNTNHINLSLTKRDFINEFPKFIASMDSPSIDGLNTYFVSYAAKKAGLKVVLSGLGADELFGSYPSFNEIPRINQIVNSIPLLNNIGKSVRYVGKNIIKNKFSSKYASLFEYGNTIGGAYLLKRGLFMPWEIETLLDHDFAKLGLDELSIVDRLNDQVKSIKDDLLKISYLESTWYMKNQLLKDSDWASMAHSLEIRVPFVDISLLKEIVPAHLRLLRIGKKNIFSSFQPNLPKSIINRKKTGFTVPHQEWAKEYMPEVIKESGLRGWSKEIYKLGGWSF